MIDEQLFYNLKEQVQTIEENYITLDDINGKFLSSNEIVNYPTKTDVEILYLSKEESRNITNELKSLIDNKMDTQILSNYVTYNYMSEYSDILLNSIDLKILNIDTYSKSEIDRKISELNIIDTDDFITKNELSEYISLSELDNILNSKNYITEHQSLEGYLKTDNFESIIDDKLNENFNSLTSYYDNKINELRDIYMSTIEEKGYITKDEIINTISQTLIDYIKTDDVNVILDNKDFVDKSFLIEHVRTYVASKLSELNFLSPDSLLDYAKKSEIPVKVSELINDKGYLIEHQSLDNYAKLIDLNDYVSKVKFETVIETLKSDINEDKGFITSDSLLDYAKKSEIPVKVSELINDKGYLTKHQSLDNYAKLVDLDNYVTSSNLNDKLIEIYESTDNKISNIDLSNYATIDKIPIKLSDLIDDVGYLKEHQELFNYVKRTELDDYVSHIEFREFIHSTGLDDINNFVVKDDIKDFAHVQDIPVKLSQLINDKKYLTEHQSLDAYVKHTDMQEYVLQTEFEKALSSLSNTGNFNGVTFDDLNDYAKKSEIPVKVSELINDKGYLTEHQSLINYVKRTELYNYVTQSELEHVQNSISSINTDLFVKHDDLNNYATTEYLDALYMLKSDKPDMTNYVQHDELLGYVKKTHLPNFDEFVKISDLPNGENYLTQSDIVGYAKLSDIPDVSGFANIEMLDKYVKNTEFEKYKKIIESKQYQTRTDIDNTLDLYVKKEDIGSASSLDIDTVRNMISEKIESVHVPVNISELINDVGYTTFNENLSGYVKRSEIYSFITMDDVEDKFLKIDDFILPSNLVYKQDLKDYVKLSDFAKLSSDITNELKENNFISQSDVNKQMSNLKTSINNKFIDVENRLSDINDSSNVPDINLNDYVRKNELNDFSVFEQYLDTKFSSIDSTNKHAQNLDDKIKNQKIWINENFIKKSEYSGDSTSSSGDINYDELYNEFYTKSESHLKFLSKEDYRGIKSAATINFEFNDYPDLFFDVLNNHDNIKINDGFYVVEEKAYIIRNNEIVPICDRRTPHWEIETTDEDWRNDEKGLIALGLKQPNKDNETEENKNNTYSI